MKPKPKRHPERIDFYHGVRNQRINNCVLTELFCDWQPLPKKFYAATQMGMNWGKPCVGAEVLAYSLLHHCCGALRAEKHWREFATDVVFQLPEWGFTISSRQIEEWIEKRQQAECGGK